MVEINNLYYQYRGKERLFEALDLDLPAGNIYGLLGKNGAGKSTLLKVMTGLLFPQSGNLDVLGHVPGDRHPDFLREVYLVTEEFELPKMSIKRYVDLYAAFYPRFSHEQLNNYLQEFKLSEKEKLSQLSYGQKKKFLLSFGLATDCRLLILDEPTNGLDIPSKSQFRKIVANAIHEERTFVISTHQARDMENLIDPIIILDNGKIVFFEDYESVSRKLRVVKLKEKPDEDGLVYSESTFSGYTVVQVNDGGEETNMNLELLFNAVVNNTEKVYSIFNQES